MPTNDSPIVREAADEVSDHQDAIRRIQDEEYQDWPNEAGFENLEEHRGPIELQISGSIPSWAAGSLFRTGPGTNKIEGTPYRPDGIFRIAHWFDGLAHIHRFDIIAESDSKHATRVVYASRRQSDKWAEYVQRNGLRDCITFAQKADPCVGIFGKLVSTWRGAVFGIKTGTGDFENVGVTVQFGVPGLAPKAKAKANNTSGGHRSPPGIWLGTDANMLCEVDRDTLEPLGIARHQDIHPSLDGPCSCAHMQRCPRTGDYFNVNVKPGAKPTYRIFRVSASTGQTEILATISRLDLPMIYFHSFFLSENFVVLCLPSSYIKACGLGILWERNMLDAIIPFDKANKCKWFVVDRIHGRGLVAEFETEAGFFFHTVNCFEEPIVSDDNDKEGKAVNVMCDVIEYPTMDIIHAMYYDVLMNREQKHASLRGSDPTNRLPRLARWRLTVALPGNGNAQGSETPYSPPTSSIWSYRPFLWFQTISQPSSKRGNLDAEKLFTILAPHVGELPTINPAYHMRSYRYVYSLAVSGRSTLVDSIIKTDMVKRQMLQWNNPHGHTPGEAIFVARPGATEEDDGVLLSVVLDGTRSESYLLCLNAQTMTEVGKAQMDFAVGLGFHGAHTTEA